MSKRPLLIVSDAITSPTGFGRVSRELAIRINAELSDVFRLGTAGYGGNTSREFEWTQYTISKLETWAMPELPSIWNDFARDEGGVLCFLFNASWLWWMADPDKLPESDLKNFIKAKPFESWLYFPVDSEGPNGRLSEQEAKIFASFDRILTYTKWGAEVVDRTMKHHGLFKAPCEHRPHGTDQNIFFPRDRHEARQCFIQKVAKRERGFINDDVVLLGVCATNTNRKDWPLAFEVCKELLDRGVNVGLWAHMDRAQKHWDLPMLADEFNMRLRTIFTNNHLTDEDLSWGMAACDCFLGIGSGEGWGLVNSSALAMGIPCITFDYAGAVEFTPQSMKIEPSAFRYDGYFANKRPVGRASTWAYRVQEEITKERGGSLLDHKFYWDGCWPDWEQWFRDGLKPEITVTDMVFAVATRHWQGWRECVESWKETASKEYPVFIVPNMNIVEAYQKAYEETTDSIISMVHDDVMIYEKDWDLRVLKQFNDPTVGIVGFGGALGHGTPDLYKVPYHLPNLARQSFMSNMRNAEVHGARFTGERDCAILDGFALFVRRSILKKWGGWPKNRIIDYFLYSEWLCTEARRQGYRIRLVGVDCEHLGGKTAGMVPMQDNYEEAHRLFFDSNKDVLPYRVEG
jgi:glycosyltransferase involved in cell wall biosynthesis